ncbi:hypothetical protein I4I73_02510 [Pseudonocardia sp. KRD-184]|uniref:Recombinase zinc beta ribbon domain-containing protein n=1 Tax=Pseudonocardia oceani TaxID=2792013 RepID=A0ABS6U242_9PSEU|nr:hypothetical protein [Pseudonocardia oceani]MBW0089598.1 hypothetical protein [Pseudonocardia oceani]MBW0094872.1 hypothetical protein [Pseudonocardia oceani]MBW0108190.1 hypothetical protein [Pseudonocardia oceani]MBW0120571.1 hypothetical protein [Pseudonocardia oceani]MBW0126275.1 hypothetical protein [Pseudonocardia oceani]
MNEINEIDLLSRHEQIAWVRGRLRYLDEMEADLRGQPWTVDCAEALHELSTARPVLLAALDALEHPTFWQRLNHAVTRAAAKGAVQQDLKRRRKRIHCWDCHGSGRRQAGGGTYRYFEDCPCGGVVTRHEATPEIDAALEGADRLRREINESWR